MNCPLCDQPTRVVETREADRRRECSKCGHRFTTSEVLKAELERSQRIIQDAKDLAERIRKAA